ncbi:hypothetical protein [Curvibacter gracilis]|uniref:hypothetical protein n=1 Tax=Curvibacter gracilis TaxID=230310 RepID=UPI0012F8D5C2|nr:hypothetical protein [Curvibacter gracilis]
MTMESTRPQNVSIFLEKINMFSLSVDAVDMSAEAQRSCDDGFVVKQVARGKPSCTLK